MSSICPTPLAAACILSVTAASVFSAAHQSAPAASRCDLAILAPLDRDGLDVRSAERVPAGAFTPPRGAGPLTDVPAFCRVQAAAAAAPASLVVFEVWLPEAWNGKMVVTGNGGYGNAIGYREMASALSQGYAAVGGDTGHQGAGSDDLLWGAGNPERIVDWGTRSIHTITAAARRILPLAAGRSSRRAYFTGCSTGGHQAYAEMQRYPQDFDGVIAGAPGNNRVRLNAGFLWQFLANRQRPANTPGILPETKLPVITRAVVAACDRNDGIADGVVDDPRTCGFDPTQLQCRGGETPDCLTSAQIDALNRMYAGAKNPRTGEQIYPGWPKGSEAPTVAADGRPLSGWHQYWGQTEPMRVNFWRYWVFDDPRWDWWAFDFDRHLAAADQRIGRLVDQVNPDLSGFKARGGKAIVYQGWQDPVVNAIDTIAYYEQVRARQRSQTETDRFFRLFLVPGMGHCGGGTGTTDFDMLPLLDAWVEQGVAPDRVLASRSSGGAVVRTRPLCPYPQKAVYGGSGSTDEAASFVCRAP